MAKKKKSTKPAEDKHVKFKRVVTPRVQKALKAIKLIGNQASKAYEYSEDDVHVIFGTLHDAVSDTEKMFTTGDVQPVDFSLD